ncbi:MAG: hypothetical protein AUH72_07190 [Acidobacteria bacterium 13_1_40CM_4_65_8]|nr:MAG: hypothetical protein AUH72_07190 [Acidobacteria bacterium 13_1_40CM_4_65_8]
MERRDFLRMISAAPLVTTATTATPATPPAAATVLYDDRAVSLVKLGKDPRGSREALWIRKADLPRVNDFEVKPQGACRADICVPIPKDMMRGDYFDVTAFARKVGQSVVADADARVWSLGEIPMLRGGFLESRVAPDFTVPDRGGRPVHLSHFRGKKVLVITWASW